jgi:hypothetical protein
MCSTGVTLKYATISLFTYSPLFPAVSIHTTSPLLDEPAFASTIRMLRRAAEGFEERGDRGDLVISRYCPRAVPKSASCTRPAEDRLATEPLMMAGSSQEQLEFLG